MLKDPAKSDLKDHKHEALFLEPGRIIRGGRWFYRSYNPEGALRLSELPQESHSLISFRPVTTRIIDHE